MNSDVSEIKSRLNIVDVLSEYIRLDKAGSNWRALCPFHNEKSPSFMVSEERQMWHCFGCGKGGDVLSFVQEMEGLGFREALKLLADKAGVELRDFNPQKTKEKNRLSEILELATKWYEHQLWNGPGKTKILDYLHERGLTDETIKEFRLGYAPKGWQNILTFLTKRGFETKEILGSGLLVQKENRNDYYDRFRARIMFPIADYSGRILGYSARVAPGEDESQAKYVNTPETEIYHKSRVLYGLDKAKAEIKKKDFVLLVEGNLDVIASYQAGLKNTIAVSGTALTEDQINIIKRYSKNIKMFFDMDPAGENATKKSVKLCLEHDLSVKIVNLPSGKDAADLAKENPKELLKAVEEAKNIMDYFFEKAFERYDKENIDERKMIIDDLLDKINLLSQNTDKNYWIKKLAEGINVKGSNVKEDETALTDALKKASLNSRVREFDKISLPKKEFLSKPKIEVLIDELIGLCLSSEDIWKQAEKEKSFFSLGDSLLNTVLERGSSVGFSFEKLDSELVSDQDKKRAERLFFEKKYSLDLNNNREEADPQKLLESFENCSLELQKEVKKNKLAKITSDLKIAEKNKDASAISFLRQEFNKISKELSQLS